MAFAARDGDLLGELQRLSTTGAAGVVLWPFRALARVPMADSPAAFLAALPWALALLALNYIWVLRTDVAFEEASAELSEKMDDVRRRGMAALHRPRASARTPFALSPDGRPETAILWKNLIQMGRVLSWTLLLRLTPVLVLLAVVLARSGRRGDGDTVNVMAAACLMVAGFAIFLGPQIMRGDLRRDLANLAVLKTWPIRGAALVRGEILAPAIVLTAIVSLALLAAAVLSTQASFSGDIASRWAYLLAAMLVAPGIILAQLLMQNALAVAFPSWVSIGSRQAGLDAMGQRMLMMLGTLLALVAAVLPAALVAGVAALVAYALVGTILIVVPGALAGATLLAEAFAGSEIVGALLDRTDIAAIDAPDA
jgi:hypothetical protein